MIWATPILMVIGAYLYALRGGHHFLKNSARTTFNRMFYLVPTFGLIYGLTCFYHFSWWSAHGQAVHIFIGVILGHGLFMDMGRWKPASGTEHEYPVTWLIGAEDYSWPFWKGWLHNFVGMSLLGAIRHSHVWFLYGQIPTMLIICYNAVGLLHGLYYEIAQQMRHFNYLGVERAGLIVYGEHLVGATMWGGIWACMTF